LKFVALALFAVLAVLQYKLWIADGGVREMRTLRSQVAEQRKENDELRERNKSLSAEVLDLKKGTVAIEERARTDLGMIGSNETFFQVVPPDLKITPQARQQTAQTNGR
jgi:cell division protein FtsB